MGVFLTRFKLDVHLDTALSPHLSLNESNPCTSCTPVEGLPKVQVAALTCARVRVGLATTGNGVRSCS